MKFIRKTLVSLLVPLTFFLTSSLEAKTPKEPFFSSLSSSLGSVIDDEELSQNYNLFYNELQKEMQKETTRLTNIRERSILNTFMRRYNRVSNRDFYKLTIEEQDILEDFLEDVVTDSFKRSFRKTDGVKELKEDIKYAFRKQRNYESKGRLNKSKKNFLNMENKVETGISPYIHSWDLGVKAYARVDELNLFGMKFMDGKIEVKSDEKLKARLRKLINEDWYAQLGFKAKGFGTEENDISLSFVRDFPKETARFSITAGYNQNYGGSGNEEAYILFSFLKTF